MDDRLLSISTAEVLRPFDWEIGDGSKEWMEQSLIAVLPHSTRMSRMVIPNNLNRQTVGSFFMSYVFDGWRSLTLGPSRVQRFDVKGKRSVLTHYEVISDHAFKYLEIF